MIPYIFLEDADNPVRSKKDFLITKGDTTFTYKPSQGFLGIEGEQAKRLSPLLNTLLYALCAKSPPLMLRTELEQKLWPKAETVQDASNNLKVNLNNLKKAFDLRDLGLPILGPSIIVTDRNRDGFIRLEATITSAPNAEITIKDLSKPNELTPEKKSFAERAFPTQISPLTPRERLILRREMEAVRGKDTPIKQGRF